MRGERTPYGQNQSLEPTAVTSGTVLHPGGSLGRASPRGPPARATPARPPAGPAGNLDGAPGTGVGSRRPAPPPSATRVEGAGLNGRLRGLRFRMGVPTQGAGCSHPGAEAGVRGAAQRLPWNAGSQARRETRAAGGGGAHGNSGPWWAPRLQPRTPGPAQSGRKPPTHAVTEPGWPHARRKHRVIP